MELPKLLHSALNFQEFLRRRDWSYCVIGGIALNRRGEPRGSRDVDVVLWTGFGNESTFVVEMLAVYEPRI